MYHGKDKEMENKIIKRSEVPEELTWRLEDIFPTKKAWEEELERVGDMADKGSSYEGRLKEGAKVLYEALTLYQENILALYKVYEYASMRRDQDTADADNQEPVARAGRIELAVSECWAYLEPEILELSDETLEKYYKDYPALHEFDVSLKEILRQKEHSLSKAEERLLASAGEMAGVPSEGFSMLHNADMRFPSVEGPNGEEVAIGDALFVPLQMSPDRDLRKKVFEAYYGRYEEFKNTLASLYYGQVKQQMFYAKARKYPSTFVAAVESNNVSPSVCDNLIESVHRHMDLMHRYVRLRKKMLGVDELHMYDVYVPMVKDYEIKVTYEEAKEISLKALAPLGEEYLSIVRRAYDERWIDVCANEGKRSGAYSANVYGVHPYMLLNWTGTLDDVFTLVHEMGHSMHSWYSSHAQSFLDSEYKIFVAEVASTTNEVLLLEYLLKENDKKRAALKEEGKEVTNDLRMERAYLLNHYLDSFKGTLYRQTMFEEFERKTNAMAEEGIPLTARILSDTYLALNKEYFGEDMISDPEIAYEWSRIPHFYYNFYVYQYATSYAAAVAIGKRILKEGDECVKQYLSFLKSGCTKDPVSLLKIAGVDLSTGTAVDESLKAFEGALDEMENAFA